MDDEQIWCMYFAGVLALKFHPRNVILRGEEFHLGAIKHAGQIADLALLEHQRRWPVEKEEPCRG